MLLGTDFLTIEHQASNIVIDEIDEDSPEIKNYIFVVAAFIKQPCLEYKRFPNYQRIIRVNEMILLECKIHRKGENLFNSFRS